MRREHFEQLNGYPNDYWGWGGEDDELFRRMQHSRIRAVKPSQGTMVDLEEVLGGRRGTERGCVARRNTTAVKLPSPGHVCVRACREWKNQLKWELAKAHGHSWRANGLCSLRYNVLRSDPGIDSVLHALPTPSLDERSSATAPAQGSGTALDTPTIEQDGSEPVLEGNEKAGEVAAETGYAAKEKRVFTAVESAKEAWWQPPADGTAGFKAVARHCTSVLVDVQGPPDVPAARADFVWKAT